MLHSVPELYLASKSPRRQELLRSADIGFKLLDIDVEETYPDELPVEEVPLFLAKKKAEAALPLLSGNSLVLAADSVVILDHMIYGKPTSPEEAISMIGLLAGRQHLVVTGVFIGNHSKSVGFSEHTNVWIDQMTEPEIKYYVETRMPLDKAGAYGIQDWIGWTKVSRIEGSFANVMGLPIHKVYSVLRDWL
jgi:septum formation protein